MDLIGIDWQGEDKAGLGSEGRGKGSDWLTEFNQICRIVSRSLSPYGRIIRIQDSVASGIPDFYYLLRGTSGWLECKLLPANGRCPAHFTLEQLMWGEEETAKGGHWFLLGLRDGTWLLYDAAGARAFKDGEKSWTRLSRTGPFPVLDLLKVLIGQPVT